MAEARERVWVVLAMRRSGHHAIINQLCYQLGTVVHLNNCVVRGFPRRAYPRAGRFRHYSASGVADSGTQPRRLFRRSYARLDDVANLVYSFEDADLSIDYRRFVEPHQSCTVVCVVRDPFNWLASSMRRGRHLTRAIDRRIVRWREHVEQCLRPGDYPYGRFVDVSYNRWVIDRAYRVALSERLQTDYRDDGMEEVVVFGIGSSFDGAAFDGRASQMGVLERWHAYAEDPFYRALLDDDRLRDLSRRYFDLVPI